MSTFPYESSPNQVAQVCLKTQLLALNQLGTRYVNKRYVQQQTLLEHCIRAAAIEGCKRLEARCWPAGYCSMLDGWQAPTEIA